MTPNKEQKQVIDHFVQDNIDKRILLVEAPPGTGKTYTAVSSAIEYTKFNLNKDNKYNKKVLILTFSKNARAQIEKQLEQLDDKCLRFEKYIEITNFHSFFQKYIWSYNRYLGLGDELIITSPKQREILLKNALEDIKKYEGDSDQYNWAEALLEGEFYPYTYAGNIKPSVKKLIPYKEIIKNRIIEINSRGYIGFSDFGFYMKKLLSKSFNLLKVIQNKYDLIILDEYQDTSDLQDEIIKMLIGKKNKAIFLADSKQMIYEWRGASSNRVKDLINYYEEEIEVRELVESMRFQGRDDIGSLLKKVREGKFDINNAIDSENIKYKLLAKNELDSYQQTLNANNATIKWEVVNSIKAIKNINKKSIGILCRDNEHVIYLKDSLTPLYKRLTQTISNNEEEHNMLSDLIELRKMQDIGMEKDQYCREIFKYIFSAIYENNIGSISRKQINQLQYEDLKNLRLPILKSIKKYIDETFESKEYLKCILLVIYLIENSECCINYDITCFIKRILQINNCVSDKLTNAFLQYQHTRAYKDLKGIYVLNVHQSKGREFDIVIVVESRRLAKEDNLLYVALSRVKEKLIIIDWEE